MFPPSATNSGGKQAKGGPWQKPENVILELKYARQNLTMAFSVWGDATYELSEKTMCVAMYLLRASSCVCVPFYV